MRLTRSVDARGDFAPPRQLSIGAYVAVGVVAVAVVLFVAAAAWHCYKRRQRTGHAARFTTWTPVKGDGSGSEARARSSRGSRLLSVLDVGHQRRSLYAAKSAYASPRTPSYHKSHELPNSAVELDGGESGKAALASQEHSIPPYTAPTSKSGQDIGPIAQYQPENVPTSRWERPGEQHSEYPSIMVPSLTTPRPAAWHSRRSEPPPPILIAPPEILRSPPDAYSTYRDSLPPNGYYSITEPSPMPSVSSLYGFMPDSASSSHSIHSARSYRSNEPLHAPTSPRSIRSVSDLSRRDSEGGSHMETPILLPPTPTYSPSFSQSQRIPIDTVNFVCLGPLPDNIPLPSPRQFQEQRMQMEQQQQLAAQRAATPEQLPPPPPPPPPQQQQQQQKQESRDLLAPSELPGRTSPTFHDLILHETGDLRPQPSPATSMFRGHSLRAHVAHVDDDDEFDDDDDDDDDDGSCRFETLRRQSTDSLGSNFTVEEEERIQAQIARNLATLGQERVVGTNDIVHIPQISEKRYSWEEV